jgi:hypothetical protein
MADHGSLNIWDRRVQEPPKGWLGSMLSFGKPLQLVADDASVPFLFASVSKTTSLLHEHRWAAQTPVTTVFEYTGFSVAIQHMMLDTCMSR